MSTETVQETKENFLVVGIITSDEFQKCRYIVKKLHGSFPKKYGSPQIRPMLDVEWNEYLTKKTTTYSSDKCPSEKIFLFLTKLKWTLDDQYVTTVDNICDIDDDIDNFINARRKYGNGFWSVTKSVLVFLNDQYIGDDRALERHISKKYRFTLTKDWYEMGKCHLAEYLGNIMSKLRQLAYLTISIDNVVVGTMLFELFNDVVPLACENFINRCKMGFDGYTGTPIHRIMSNSWIQCGGWSLQEKKMRCENYAVPHDRRGVLSTCNDGIHVNNSTQFFVTLAPTPWMDYRYVAFGQLIQGADVLKKIEAVPTYYQSPKHPIDIVKTGEFIFTENPDYVSSTELDRFRHLRDSALLDTLIGPLRAPVPSTDSFYSPKKVIKHTWKPGVRTAYWGYPGYVLPEEGEEKADADYLKKYALPYFNPYYFLNLTNNVLSTPGSSDVTL